MLNPDFLFSSPYRSLVSRGTLARIERPAADGDAFLQQVQLALDAARRAGQASPVVVGAIPFDLRQPSTLVVPQEVEFVERETLLASAHRVPMHPLVKMAHNIPDKRRFKQGVRQAKANFQHSDIRKAVLSRLCEIELEDALDTPQVLANLMVQNPCAHYFRVPMGDGVDLIGASPELLLRQEGLRVKTFPLAGTAARHPVPAHDELLACGLLDSAKDQHEHRLVVEDIRSLLAPLCETLTVPSRPELVSTPTLWHLGTPIEGLLKPEMSGPLSVLRLACRLHPTPAVCGFPRQQARKLVHLIESFERGLFTGIVGWCDAHGNGEWAVIIRCAIIRAKQVRLFAGVGVVEASCPDAEWAETRAKLGTMLRAMGLSEEVTA